MQKLSPKKQLAVIRHYFTGLPYDEIVAKTGVSKGAVSNVIRDLKEGHILEVQGPVEQLELLRELAQDLKNLKLSPGQALTGLSLLSNLQEMEIEPADIQKWADVYRDISSSEDNRRTFIKTALTIEELWQKTGLDIEEIEAKVCSLKNDLESLKPFSKQLQQVKKQLTTLKNEKNDLESVVNQLKRSRDQLSKDVTSKEKREAELSSRIEMLEQRAQDDDEKLATARKELKEIAGLGLSPEDLAHFIYRLIDVAKKQGVKPEYLRDRFISELEALNSGMSLDSMVKTRQDKLAETEKRIIEAERQRKAEEKAIKKLEQKQAQIQVSIEKEQTQLQKEMGNLLQITQQNME